MKFARGFDMKFTVNITCENDVFYPDPRPEIARILREMAATVETDEGGFYRTVNDANGNDVGRFKLFW